MDTDLSVPDSTDWLPTPLPSLSVLESALHCQICKEFYDTPMLTSCSHSFCSKCIRTSLSNDGKCPACRAADQASKLRNNWALQEIVAAFRDARPKVLEMARDVQISEEKDKKRKRTIADSSERDMDPEDARRTRSKSRRLAASQFRPESVEIEDSANESDYQPEQEGQDGLVMCPMGCGKRMKIDAVDGHIDRCEDEKKNKQLGRPKSRAHLGDFPPPSNAAVRNPKPADRLPELSYSLLNETKLAKKLKELGIPSTGSKQLMIKRHREWVNLWNANCDSSNPRSKRDLLRELDAWERTQGGRAPLVNGLASTIMTKEFDAAGWSNSNRSDFDRLIADAKRTGAPLASRDVTRSDGQEGGSDEQPIDKTVNAGTSDVGHQGSPLCPRTDAAEIQPNPGSSPAPKTFTYPPPSGGNPVQPVPRDGNGMDSSLMSSSYFEQKTSTDLCEQHGEV